MRLADDLVLDQLHDFFGLQTKHSKLIIVGLGATGLSVARFLSHYSFEFKLIDSRRNPPMAEQLSHELPNINLITGNFENFDFSEATHLIVSPGIALTPQIKSACLKGVRLVSDIDLFALSTNRPIIAITGSNGKSTVTTMLGEMGNAAGKKTRMGGNLGTAALDLLNQEAELYVLELSSFQLERTSALKAVAATVLNLSADHLDRHETFENYCIEKEKVFKGNGIMVLNADDSNVKSMHKQARRCLWFGVHQPLGFHVETKENQDYLVYNNDFLMPCRHLSLEGQHNIANALAALALGFAAGLAIKPMCQALAGFQGLAHRMQQVAIINGVKWVNDSKATNIGACIAALDGYKDKVILLAGGDAKGADMNELQASIYKKVKNIILMGKDANLMESALNNGIPVYHADSMAAAVLYAANIAFRGDTILLSPACASLDQYQNYQHRGNCFMTAVKALETG
ncbi:MAG: UDP-N-acetylmuramoyl-L-alanine--D-glutamate ligase [Methylococcales bacterium]|nr:UDP-N-acetylmuramoyl-L-alanine--D-glutamate ligase [Methylococcales bacterium]